MKPRVLLGVTGCIAAYKACEIVRGLQKAGCDVQVVMTEHACEFVGPVTFRALTGHKVPVTLFDDPADPIHHITLAQNCDLMLVAPCTVNVLAKMAHGIADDLLTSTLLANTAPLVVAPAANVHMYEAAPTQGNMETLRRRGVHIIEGDAGYLACGDEGKGRLADPPVIVAQVLELLREGGFEVGEVASGLVTDTVSGVVAGASEVAQAPEVAASVSFPAAQDEVVKGEGPQAQAGAFALRGKTVLITAGPTVEPIDAVRYVSNYSSGKMGYALAQAAHDEGARVILVSGPVSQKVPAGVQVVGVKTARDMLHAVEQFFSDADIFIAAAAVADVRPAHAASYKLKKGADDASLANISLVENPDVLATVAAHKRADQYVVGFAAETNEVIENARKKLVKKHADMIVANEVGDHKTFGADTNQVWLITRTEEVALPEMPKQDVARAIVQRIATK
jgi:phosphopantothenoylcysteine decarboxylase/phosphopantothenate--cysteine ligase